VTLLCHDLMPYSRLRGNDKFFLYSVILRHTSRIVIPRRRPRDPGNKMKFRHSTIIQWVKSHRTKFPSGGGVGAAGGGLCFIFRETN